MATLQNLFLERISEKSKIQRQNLSIGLMSLSGKQIISNEISEECKSSLIENHNSFTYLKYGMGNVVLYDIKQILSEFEASLLAGKAKIDLEGEVRFAFTNVGNPFDMFDSILEKIKP